MLRDEFDKNHRRLVKQAQNRRYRLKVIREAITAYGGKCIECGCNDVNVLELSHENGGGNEQRSAFQGGAKRAPGGWNFYVKLRKLGWPQDLGLALRCTEHHIHPRGNPFSGRGKRSVP